MKPETIKWLRLGRHAVHERSFQHPGEIYVLETEALERIAELKGLYCSNCHGTGYIDSDGLCGECDLGKALVNLVFASHRIAELERKLEEASAAVLIVPHSENQELERESIAAKDQRIKELERSVQVLQSLNEGLRMMRLDEECFARVMKAERAEERERCLDEAPFRETEPEDEAPTVCWNNGYNAGVADYKAKIRALGDE